MWRALVICVFAVAAISLAWAQSEPPNTVRQVLECAAISDDAARLTCYDRGSVQLRDADASGRLVCVDQQHVAALEREAFGFRLPSLSGVFSSREDDGGVPRETLERIEMEVARVVRHLDGRHSYVMTNGQTWTQVEPGSSGNVRPGDRIAVRRAAFNSYMLSPARGSAHRVRRQE
ncbi:MAG: hypothetical protein K2P58_00345 [Hyphomonadaceae bacterium]|nr:hypothetical protein [Hyphomonadaceae bacterium]